MFEVFAHILDTSFVLKLHKNLTFCPKDTVITWMPPALDKFAFQIQTDVRQTDQLLFYSTIWFAACMWNPADCDFPLAWQADRRIDDLYEDLRDGHNLISLLEVLSGETLVSITLKEVFMCDRVCTTLSYAYTVSQSHGGQSKTGRHPKNSIRMIVLWSTPF